MATDDGMTDPEVEGPGRGWLRRVDDRLRGMPWLVRPVAYGAVALAALLGVDGALGLIGSGRDPVPPSSTPETVSAFFLAQRDGDCGRLLDLVSEESWSAGGDRTRDEFLEQCGVALENYRPEVASVNVEVPPEDVPATDDDGEDRDEPVVVDVGDRQGELVHEDDEWRVQLDGEALMIGRSAEATVRGYLAAYQDGDCELLLSYLSESARSPDDGGQDEVLSRCEDRVAAGEGGRHLEAANVAVSYGERSEGGGSGREASATVQLDLAGISSSAFASGSTIDEVALVLEDLQWRLDHNEDHPSGSGDELLRAPGLVVLPDRLVDAEAIPGDESCTNYVDSLLEPEAFDESMIEGGVMREFSGRCPVEYAMVYRAHDAGAADEAAGEMAQEILDRDLPTVEETEARGISDPEGYVASRRPNREVEIPGASDVRAVGDTCYVDECASVDVFLVHVDLVVQFSMGRTDPDRLESLVAAQEEAL